MAPFAVQRGGRTHLGPPQAVAAARAHLRVSSSRMASTPVCVFWLRGQCTHSPCRFLHPGEHPASSSAMAAAQVRNQQRTQPARQKNVWTRPRPCLAEVSSPPVNGGDGSGTVGELLKKNKSGEGGDAAGGGDDDEDKAAILDSKNGAGSCCQKGPPPPPASPATGLGITGAGKNDIPSYVFLAGAEEDKAKNPEVLDKNGAGSGLTGGPPPPPASPATEEDIAKNPEVLDKNGAGSGLMGGPPPPPPASPATEEDKAKNPEVLDKNGAGFGLMGGPPPASPATEEDPEVLDKSGAGSGLMGGPPPPPDSPATGLGINNGDEAADRGSGGGVVVVGGGVCRKRKLNSADEIESYREKKDCRRVHVQLDGAGGDGGSRSSVASVDPTFSLLTTLGGHRNAITGILVHAHVSNKLFSGCCDGTIRVWDTITWQCVQVIELGVPVACLARECGFIFAGARGGVHGCRLQTKAGLVLPVSPARLQVRSLEISGSTLFAGVEDGTVLAWKASADGCCVDDFGPATVMRGHTSAVLSLLAGGERLYSGSADCTIRAWDLDTLHCDFILSRHTDAVTALLCWGHFLLSASLDNTVRVWGCAASDQGTAGSGTFVEVHRHREEHEVLVLAGMGDPAGMPILLCSVVGDGVRLYDLPSFAGRGVIRSKGDVTAIHVGANGGLFFTGDTTGELNVWRWSSPPERRQNPPLEEACGSPDRFCTISPNSTVLLLSTLKSVDLIITIACMPLFIFGRPCLLVPTS